MKRAVLFLLIVVGVLTTANAMARGRIEGLAMKIVSKADTSDQKMYKIEKWVQENIAYMSDIKLYGREDASYLPAVTIRKGKADCEDGAFLTQALAAYAGIPLARVRTLFGRFVSGRQRQGHAWTIYKRETDDQWVVTDWTDKRTKPPLDQRTAYINDRYFEIMEVFAYLVIVKKRPLRATYIRGGFTPGPR